MLKLVPYIGTRVVVCDDDGRRASLAATTLERMGYGSVAPLGGGIRRWSAEGLPTEWGTNVPSKEFGEKVQAQRHVPELTPEELHGRLQRGEKLVILDARTPEEHQGSCIPGSRSVPGGELVLRIADLVEDPDAPVIVHCAGRTRSIIGAETLRRAGLQNVYALQNGTMGWVLAGLTLETGSPRLQLPGPSAEGAAAAEALAARIAAEESIPYLTIEELRALTGKVLRENAYFIDVRTKEEYVQGHIPGFQWFPGGQAVQRADDVVAVRHGHHIVFSCDGRARATMTASWYRQMGFPGVSVVGGGASAWAAHGGPLERGMPEERPVGYEEAQGKARLLSPQRLQAALKEAPAPAVVFVDTSRDFSIGHVPGSHWAPRGWLELTIAAVAASKEAPLVVTCSDGFQSTLAAATLQELGYQNLAMLDGGMAAWRGSGLPIESGLRNLAVEPEDVVTMGTERSREEMLHYLAWEEELGRKYR